MTKINVPGPDSRIIVWCDFAEQEAIARADGTGSQLRFCQFCGSTDHTVM